MGALKISQEMCYKDDDGTIRGVDYKYVIASLLNELKAQKKRGDELEARIQVMESKQ